MDAYKCIVRLGGEIGQEVPKNNVCAAHIIMMQHEHGDDAIHSIERISKKMVVSLEGDIAPRMVTQAMARNFLDGEFGEEKVGKVFGAFHGVLLPEVLKGFETLAAIPKKKVTTIVKSATVAEDNITGAADEIAAGEEDDGIGEEEEEETEKEAEEETL